MNGRLAPERAQALVEHLLEDQPNVPTALVYAAEDEFFEPAFERFVARELCGIDPIEIPGGHFPMAEEPEALAILLEGLAT